jgi:hypothetical protein
MGAPTNSSHPIAQEFAEYTHLASGNGCDQLNHDIAGLRLRALLLCRLNLIVLLNGLLGEDGEVYGNARLGFDRLTG